MVESTILIGQPIRCCESKSLLNIVKLAPVPAEQRGKFYGGDCYIVFYTYMLGTLPNYIIYIWQGRHANIDEVTASAYLAVELDRQFRDEPVQIRVTMGKEPRTGLISLGWSFDWVLMSAEL